jgi:hypothetical protein
MTFVHFLEDMGKMPDNCNGLELIDDTKEFCKFNCRWSQKRSGRYAKPDTIRKKPLGPNAKIKNPKSICLVLEKDHLDFIKKQALQRSVNEGVSIEANQMIREALQRAFPAPKQFDMFGNAK